MEYFKGYLTFVVLQQCITTNSKNLISASLVLLPKQFGIVVTSEQQEPWEKQSDVHWHDRVAVGRHG